MGPERAGRKAVAFLQKLNDSKDMSRYYFHVRDRDGDVSRDQEGQDLPDLAAAQREAIFTNREMLGERILHGGTLDHRQIEIADSDGKVLATVTACDVLFRDGQLNEFKEDVTKSAPSASLKSKPAKPSEE